MDARDVGAILFLGGLLLVPLSSLAASEWSPAVLAEEAIRGIEAIDFDLADEQAFAIRCSMRVSNRGRSRKSVCLETPDRLEMSREVGGAVRDVVEQFQHSPAVVDGRRRSSWINFVVAVFQANGGTRLRVRPNHGLNVERLGTADYTAPQRYTFNREARCTPPRGGAVVALTRVGVDGEPVSSKVIGAPVGSWL